MHRGSMGLDRNGYSGSSGGGGGYRRDYTAANGNHSRSNAGSDYSRNYRSGYGQRGGESYSSYGGDDGSYGDLRGTGAYSGDREGASYNGNGSGSNSRHSRTGAQEQADFSISGGGRSNGVHGGANGDAGAKDVPPQSLATIEKRIYSMQQDMSQAIHDVTTKDNEKFDLIFSILTELQRRQAELEESVRGLKAHFATSGGSCASGSSQQPLQNGQQPQGGQHAGTGSTTEGSTMNNFGMAAQVSGSPMGQQMGGYIMSGQQQMGQFGGMMAADGSQGYFTPTTVVVAMPPGSQMAHGAYAVPQMMSPAGSMQAMPQQMVQFVPGSPTNGNVVVPAGSSQVSSGDGQQWSNGQHQGWSTGDTSSNQTPSMSNGGVVHNITSEKVSTEDHIEKIRNNGSGGANLAAITGKEGVAGQDFASVQDAVAGESYKEGQPRIEEE